MTEKYVSIDQLVAGSGSMKKSRKCVQCNRDFFRSSPNQKWCWHRKCIIENPSYYKYHNARVSEEKKLLVESLTKSPEDK